MMRPHVLTLLTTLLLASCGGESGDNAQSRIALDEARAAGQQGPTLSPSPDIAGAAWQANDAKGSISFGKPGSAPYLTLACEKNKVTIIRHAPADKGAKALFALIGNGQIARINMDEAHGEWRGTAPATDPQLSLLTGSGPVEATLPGAGTLNLSASPLPGEFVIRCAPLPPVPLPPRPE